MYYNGRFLNFNMISLKARSSGFYTMLKVDRAIRKELNEL